MISQMFVDPQNTLYIVLAIATALLTIFLCVALIYLILILRDVNKVTDKVQTTVDRINAFVVKPLTVASAIVDHVRPLIESALEKRTAKKRRR